MIASGINAVQGGLAAALLVASAAMSAAAEEAPVEVPGPSEALFAKPFYTCLRNYYVAPNGRDTNDGSQVSPWATLQRADTSAGGRVAGDCVNVAPGTYAAGLRPTRGGNLASPTGYVVYRCQALDGCRITAMGGNAAPALTIIAAGRGPNYIVIDGFELVANKASAYGAGVYVSNNATGAPVATQSAHHIWVINNIIHGYGEAGIGTNEADWLFILHNDVYGNSAVTCDAQGSGIGVVVAKATADYTPTESDRAWAPFHQVIAWNISHDNALTQCGNAASAYNTDGNGIIIDTFNGEGVDGIPYPNETLVAYNIVYGNGGKGIQVFRASHVTVANNTSYNNNLDPWNAGFPRGEISNSGGTFNTYLNNIAYAVPAASITDPRCRGARYDKAPAPCPLMANVAFFGGNGGGVNDSDNSWANNISRGGTPPWGWGPRGNVMLHRDTMSCTSNICDVPLLLADPSIGNFALANASPAIGYGRRQPYLSPQSVDAGACYHTLSQCP